MYEVSIKKPGDSEWHVVCLTSLVRSALGSVDSLCEYSRPSDLGKIRVSDGCEVLVSWERSHNGWIEAKARRPTLSFARPAGVSGGDLAGSYPRTAIATGPVYQIIRRALAICDTWDSNPKDAAE